MSARSIS